MEGLKGLDVTSIRRPCFAAIEQHRDTDSLVDSYLGGDGQLAVEGMQQYGEGGRSSLDTMLNFTVQTEVSTQYAPKYVNCRASTRRSPCTVKGDAGEP